MSKEMSEFEKRTLELQEAHLEATRENTAALALLRQPQPVDVFAEGQKTNASYRRRPIPPQRYARIDLYAHPEEMGPDSLPIVGVRGAVLRIQKMSDESGGQWKTADFGNTLVHTAEIIAHVTRAVFLGHAALAVLDSTDPLKEPDKVRMHAELRGEIRQRLSEHVTIYNLRRLCGVLPEVARGRCVAWQECDESGNPIAAGAEAAE